MKAKRLFLLSVLLSLALIGETQIRFQQKDTVENGTITFARLRTDSIPLKLESSGKILREMHKMRANDEMRLTKTDLDELGRTHQYFQQYYKGVRVAYGTYTVHASKDKYIETVLGNFQPVGDVVTSPKLSEAQALQYALKYVNAEIYKWQIPEEQKWIKEYFNETYYPKGELVIVKDRLKTNGNYRLAYKFDIYAHKPLSRDYIYVDAITGEVIEKDSRIHGTNANGIAYTRYSEVKSIVTDSFNGGYRLRETRNNSRIETYNMNSTASYSQVDFVDNDNVWTSAEFNNASKDNAALDAHWGTEMVYDYFNQVHGRSSYDGNGGPLLSYIHANLKAMGYSDNGNAFWDGQRMTYGDGTSLFSPLTSLDICAHEIAHGVCEKTAKLRYLGESGAIDEGLSDIWAACVEHWAAPGKQTWLIGEEILNSIVYNCLRNLQNPKSTNAAEGQHPNTYHGDFWDYNGEPHNNSTVLSHWFYLVSQGGSGTNDLENTFSVSGIGINNAANIVFRTERWTLPQLPLSESEINFAQFREATISASTDLFGVNSCQTMAVTNAWYAVGVGSSFQFTGVSVTNPTLVCSSGATFSVSNLPSGASVSWSTSSNLAQSSSSGSSAVFIATGNGSGTVTATVDLGCGSVTLPSKTVWVGKPSMPYTVPNRGVDMAVNEEIKISLTSTPGSTASTGYWWATGVLYPSTSQYGSSCFFDATSTGHGSVYVTTTNQCGTSATFQIPILVQEIGGGTYTISPNPASSEVTVDIVENSSNTRQATSNTVDEPVSIRSIKVFDQQGNMVVFESYNNSSNAVLSVSSLRKGIYIVLINDSEKHTMIKE